MAVNCVIFFPSERISHHPIHVPIPTDFAQKYGPSKLSFFLNKILDKILKK